MSMLSCFLVVGFMACGGGGKSPTGQTDTKTKSPEEARRELGELGIQYDRESFIKAIENDDILAVNLFLNSGMSPDTKNDNGEPVLIWAVKNNKLKIVQILLSKGADSNTKYDNKSALFLAVENGNIDIIQTLISNGANVNDSIDMEIFFTNDNKKAIYKIPLLTYVLSNAESLEPDQRKVIVKLLIDSGANVNAFSSLNGQEKLETALYYATQRGYIEIVKELLKAGADVNIGFSLLTASREGHTEIVRILLESGANVNIQNLTGNTALSLAINSNSEEIVKLLLQAGADPNTKSNGWPPLIEAALKGFINICQLLLDAGADINATNEGGWTALIIKSQSDIDIVRFLLERGADVNINGSTDGVTALMNAAAGFSPGMVDLLLEAEADVNAQDSMGSTALMYATNSMHQWSVNRYNNVQSLLNANADITVRNNNGDTATMIAGRNGYIDIVQLIGGPEADNLAAATSIANALVKIIREGFFASLIADPTAINGKTGSVDLVGNKWTFNNYSPDGQMFLSGDLLVEKDKFPNIPIKGVLVVTGSAEAVPIIDIVAIVQGVEITATGIITLNGIEYGIAGLIQYD